MKRINHLTLAIVLSFMMVGFKIPKINPNAIRPAVATGKAIENAQKTSGSDSKLWMWLAIGGIVFVCFCYNNNENDKKK